MKISTKPIKFVKVIATRTVKVRDRVQSITCNGIKVLSEATIFDYISKFVRERGLPQAYALHCRGPGSYVMASYMIPNSIPETILSFQFVEFEEKDLGYHAKQLSDIELKRDMKDLKWLQK